MSKPLEVTDENFRTEVLESDRPVLVDFWAEWCAPCRALGPVIEQIAVEHGDRVKVVKLNIEDNPQAAGAFGIRSIPTVMLIEGGAVRETLVGVRPKAEYVEALQQLA